MRAGDGDGVFKPAGDEPEQLCALDERQMLRLCGDKLGVILTDGSGVDHHVRTLDIFGGVPHMHRDAECTDAFQVVGLVVVRTGEGIALCMQNLGKRAHARTADADKMDGMNIL